MRRLAGQLLLASIAVLAVAAGMRLIWTLMPVDRPVIPIGVAQPTEPADATGVGSNRDSFRDAARTGMRSVVNVYTLKRGAENGSSWRLFGGEVAPEREPAASLGSGVVVTDQGHVLTNNHVVAGADEIAVAMHDGRTARADIVGLDPETDLAVLRVRAQGLQPVEFGDPTSISVGDIVLAIGNPFGVGQTVTMGIVSATGRSGLGVSPLEDFIQTDAAINPGNSGGALIDVRGRLVGINSAIYSRSGGSLGIGFAIPASLAQDVMRQLIERGSVIRGWIGVSVGPLPPAFARQSGAAGAFISGVLKAGPADRAGVRPGDVITKVGDRAVVDGDALVKTVTALEPGSRESLHVLRSGRETDVTVVVGRRPPAKQRIQREE